MSAPILVQLLPSCVSDHHRDLMYRSLILVFTFFCYTCYHMSRKPISVVKSVLHHDNCSSVDPLHPVNTSDEYWCDWAPFNTPNYLDLLGTLDLCYLFSYAVAMFVSGHISDRANLRYFLSAGMILSGVFTIGFGLGYFYNVHTYVFYVVMQVLGGAFQATGWPVVVACIGNWFGKGKRGLIMGIWNAHTSIGNILGSVIAGVFVEENWGLSFVVPGVIIGIGGILVFLFLVPHPRDVDCPLPDHSDKQHLEVSRSPEEGEYDEEDECETEFEESGEVTTVKIKRKQLYIVDEDDSSTDVVQTTEPTRDLRKAQAVGNQNEDLASQREFQIGESTPLISKDGEAKERPISLWKALTIPGVVEFSLCLFFAKLVSYTFLYWLPKYLSQSVSAAEAAYVSTIFDVGGILGGVLAGYLSDRFQMRAIICVMFLVLVAPVLFLYNEFATSVPFWANCVLLGVCGAGVNGPYTLITTAVSADLGTHKTVRGNSKALGMVAAIIDGTGSIGAAIGPMLTGVISGLSEEFGWTYVFYMLIVSDFVAAMMLVRLMVKEICGHRQGLHDDVVIIVRKPVAGSNTPVRQEGVETNDLALRD